MLRLNILSLSENTDLCTSYILETHDIKKHFDACATSAEVDEGKPDPGLITRAMNKIKASAEETIVIGDTEEDIKAGRTAGCITVGIGIDGDYRAEALCDIPQIVEIIEKKSINYRHWPKRGLLRLRFCGISIILFRFRFRFGLRLQTRYRPRLLKRTVESFAGNITPV